MTIEQILNMSADELENLTDAQLVEYFTPYLTFTKPSLVKENLYGTPKKTLSTAASEDRRARARFVAEQLGIDFDETMKGIDL